MQNIKNRIGIVAAIVSIIALVYLGQKGYLAASKYEALTYQQSQEMGSSNITQNKVDKLINLLSLGLIKDKHEITMDELSKERAVYKKESNEHATYFAITSFIILLLYFLLPIRSFTIVSSLAALTALIYGLITPILMVIIQKKIAYVGDVVLSFESKSIAGSIVKLYNNSDWVVASVILLFSVLIPFAKTISILVVSISKDKRFAGKIVKLLKALGKWSMMDVFVVAVFLVYLTSRGSEVSTAEVEIGLYFFVIYVILSIVASLSAEKMLDSKD